MRDRFARTMEEAFGPGAHNRAGLQPMQTSTPLDHADRIVLGGCSIAAAVLIVLMLLGVLPP